LQSARLVELVSLLEKVTPMNDSFRPRSRREFVIWLVALGLLLTAVTLFLELAEDVWLNEGFAWDAIVMLGIHRLSQPWLDMVFSLITQTAGGWIVLPVVGTAVWFWRHDQRSKMWLMIASFGGTVFAQQPAQTALCPTPS
jgi:hypothetical protein